MNLLSCNSLAFSGRNPILGNGETLSTIRLPPPTLKSSKTSYTFFINLSLNIGRVSSVGLSFLASAKYISIRHLGSSFNNLATACA